MSDNKKLVVTIPATKGTVDSKRSTAVLNEAGSIRAEMTSITTMVEKIPAPTKITIPMKAPAADKPAYRWIWSMLRTLTFKKTDVNDALKGPLVYANFPKIVEGGGLAWLEPILGEQEPTNSATHGYFVAAKGKPAFLSAEWREYSPNNDGAIITGSARKFRESVQLHIYTQAMYGHEIKIFLMDHDTTSADDDLPPWERTDGKADIEKGKQTPNDAIKHFTRQVKITKILNDETTRGAKQVTDYVLKDKDGKKTAKIAADGIITYEAFVQKVIIDVFIDDLWKPGAGESLKIYPVLKSKNGKISKSLANAFITVTEDEKVKESPLMYGGNKPVIVGDIPTNSQRFQPCKYSMITVEGKDDGLQTIFNENILDFKPPENLTFNIVAGGGPAKKTIKLKVESLVTHAEECTATPKHKDHVIDLSSFLAKGYKKEDEKAGVKRPGDSDSAAKGKVEVKLNNYKYKRDTGSSFSGVIKSSDTELEFDAEYKYMPEGLDKVELAKRVLGYIWIPAAQVDHFPVTIQTCRWKHLINFAIYPDIKWTAALAFNMKEEDFKQLKEKFANDNKGKGITGKMQRFVLNRMESVEKIGDKVKDKYSKPTPVLDHYNESNAREIGQMMALPESKDAPPADVKTKGKFAELLEVLRKFQFSIKVEWNNDKESIEPIQELVQKYCGMIRKVWELAQGAKDILEGKYTAKADVEGDGKDPDAFITKNKDSADKNIQGLISKMQRKPVDYELQFPKVGLAASWYYETMPPVDKSSELWGAGKTVLIKLEAKPLIGLEVKWDFLELLCRRHPLAYAILKTVDALLYLLADDESKVVLNVSITGKIDMEATFKHNTVGGNVFTREAGHSDKKEELIKGGAFISVKVECKLNLAKTTTFLTTKVVVSFGMGLEGSSGLGLQGIFGSDEEGLYLGLDLVFEGIKIEGMVEGKISVSEKVREKKKKDATSPEVAGKPAKYNSIFDYNPKASFEIGIDEKRLSLPKLYLTKKESDG
ncbi:MAG: hypothetical protein J7623_04955 [Chitinophaga sp.]|uniref:hypothetical protein n=1 Tax=Chitinophaga sp. TaxID=1869181 RepID=UPI001B1F99D6|nr:hypothetical protein [Chitinophaga sp.]MBO9727967.1 hypothetical protein [Chitinophaga sp.]